MIPENYARLSRLGLRAAGFDRHNRDFRAAQKANRQASPTDTAIYVHLRAVFLIPAFQVRAAILGQPERMNKRDADLAAVGVPGKYQVHVAGDMVEITGRVEEGDFVSFSRNAREPPIQPHSSAGGIVQADEPDIGAQFGILVHEQMDAGVFVELTLAAGRTKVVIILPIAAHKPNAERRMELLINLLAIPPRATVAAEAIAGDHDDVWLLGGEDRDDPAFARTEAMGVKVGQLGDLERGGNGSLDPRMGRLDAIGFNNHAVDQERG